MLKVYIKRGTGRKCKVCGVEITENQYAIVFHDAVQVHRNFKDCKEMPIECKPLIKTGG